MALIYRAIWEEDRAPLIEVVADTARRWLAEKGLVLDALAPGEVRGTYREARSIHEVAYDLTVGRAAEGGIEAFQLRLHEQRVALGEQTTTVCTVLVAPGRAGTLWVDLERVSDDPYARVATAAPELVRTLIAEGAQPRVGHVRLESGPRVVAAQVLAGLVRNAARRLPLVVFAHDPIGASLTMARASAAYDRLAGVAQVLVLAPGALDAFADLVGPDLAVPVGAARLFLPNRGPRGLDPLRHRGVSRARASLRPEAAAELFAAMLASGTAAPAPPEFEHVRRALNHPGRDDRAYLELVEAELRARDAALAALRDAIDDRDLALFELAEENKELSAELNRYATALARALEQPIGATGGRAGEEALPGSVETIGEALRYAGRLPNLVIHPDAPRDIELLERAVEAAAWANGIWRGLLALSAYASAPQQGRGGFWEWCKAGPPFGWPASPKKLAMRESEGVMNDRRLRACRLLPVATDVDASGRIEMVAHLKIAEGGGPLAPRIYFREHGTGPARTVHVGFIGPHAHMPNLGTN